MTQLRIDPVTRDLVREGDTFVRVSGPQEYRQHAQLRLGIFEGELFLDARNFTRWLGMLFEKGTLPQLSERHLTERILGTPGVVSVTSIEVSAPNALRNATCRWSGATSAEDGRRRIPTHDVVSLTMPTLIDGG